MLSTQELPKEFIGHTAINNAYVICIACSNHIIIIDGSSRTCPFCNKGHYDYRADERAVFFTDYRQLPITKFSAQSNFSLEVTI